VQHSTTPGTITDKMRRLQELLDTLQAQADAATSAQAPAAPADTQRSEIQQIRITSSSQAPPPPPGRGGCLKVGGRGTV
jgi:hypothetical protein